MYFTTCNYVHYILEPIFLQMKSHFFNQMMKKVGEKKKNSPQAHFSFYVSAAASELEQP